MRLYQIDQRILQEDSEPRGCGCDLRCTLHFARIHKMLRTTPSMAADISDHIWSLEEIVMMADSYMPKPAKRAPTKRKPGCLKIRRRPNQVVQAGGWIFTSIHSRHSNIVRH
jgi:hypothetical protein